MLRVNSSDVLVVPPFECAWVEDDVGILKRSAACIVFEAQGDNDATLILKPKPGSKRWQHMKLATGPAQSNLELDHNYTIIFGSHRNSCLKIEKNSQECYRVDTPALISSNNFVTCWVDYNNGHFSLGIGQPGAAPYYSWRDAEPVEGVQHVGLGTWDKHVCFRNIDIRPPLASSRTLTSTLAKPLTNVACSIPTLTIMCQDAILRGLTSFTICSAILLIDLLQPVLDRIAPALIVFLARNLEQVLEADPQGFQAVPAFLLAELMGNPCLECCEKKVFDAVSLWASGNYTQSLVDREQLSADIDGLLLLIRFPLMTAQELQTLRHHPFAKTSPVFTDSLSEAVKARMQNQDNQKAGGALAVEGKRHVKAVESSSPSKPRFMRRHAPDSKHLMFVSNNDRNGISRWLGTFYGSQPWVNPVLAGMMQVTASSPICKQTDPKAVVSDKFLRLNMAGPGKSGTWWLIDLGKQHRLICNYYLLRHDGSPDFPRDWVLQGSTDGGGWVDLKEHKKDQSISMSGQTASWQVTSHAASMAYRMFRILLRAPNASAVGKGMTFHLSVFELYGHFFRLP